MIGVRPAAVFLASLVYAVVPAQAAFSLLGEKFTAKPIEFTVVDFESGQPIEGATAVAIWQYRAGLEGGGDGPFVNLLETTSDRHGKIRFPGWGPVKLDGTLRPALVAILKSGYGAAYAENVNLSSNAAQQDFDYNGLSVRMKRSTGDRKQYARDVGFLSNLLRGRINYMGRKADEARCDWTRIPMMLKALMDEEATLQSEGIAPGLLPSQLAASDAYLVRQGCESPRYFLARLRPVATKQEELRPSPGLNRARELLDMPASSDEQLAEAKAMIDVELKKDGDNYLALMELARLRIRSGWNGYRSVPNRTGDQVYGVRWYRDGSLGAAIEDLRHALRVKPDYAEAYILLGHILNEQLKPEEAALMLMAAEAIGTPSLWLQIYFAEVDIALGERESARNRWERVIRENGSDELKGRARAGLLGLFSVAGNGEGIIELHREMVRASPDDLATLINAITMFIRFGAFDEAIEYSRRLLRLQEAITLRNLEDYKRRNPDVSPLRLASLKRLNRWDLAHALYGKWAELVAAGRDTEAASYFDEAYAISPDLQATLAFYARYPSGEVVVPALATKKGVPVDVRDHEGTTPLIIAARENRVQMVKLLLNLGADPGLADKLGWTPLILAARNANEELVRLLLAKGADTRSKAQEKDAARWAETRARADIARLIRDASRPLK